MYNKNTNSTFYLHKCALIKDDEDFQETSAIQCTTLTL